MRSMPSLLSNPPLAEASPPHSGNGRELDEASLRQIDRDYMSWADTVHYQARPILASGCKGELVFDNEGRSYIDTQMWHSSCNFGYRNPEIEAAVMAQLLTMPQMSGDFLHEEKLLVAKEVAEAIERRTGLKGRVSFNVGGSLLVEDALKIARKNTGKNRVGVLMGGYHGRSLATLGLSSSHRYREPFNEFPDRAAMFPYANCSQCFYEKSPDQCELFCGKMIAKAFSNEFFGLASEKSTELGAFLVEPCQGRGYTIPPRKFFQNFIPELHSRGVLIISDEIQAGMFRTGKLFAFEHFGFVPDIITLSKSFTNGLSPVGLVWAREELVEPAVFGPGHAHSNFANHPMGTAAALATWRYMMRQDYETTVPAKGAYLLSQLNRIKEKHPSFIRSVDGLGLLLNIVLADRHGRPFAGSARLAATLAQEQDFSYQGKTYRMILNAGGYSLNVIKLAPYLDVTLEEMDRTVAILDQLMTKIGQQLPASSGG